MDWWLVGPYHPVCDYQHEMGHVTNDVTEASTLYRIIVVPGIITRKDVIQTCIEGSSSIYK